MTEYIERDALLDDISAAVKHRGMGEIIGQTLMRYVKRQPAADVAPVVHGRWIKDDFLSDDVNNAEKCSQCGELIGWFGNLPKYCPECGAKMDGGEKDG